MIRRLKTKFILLTMTALFILLAVIVAGMNIINYNSVIKDADAVLTVLSGNKGRFPEAELSPDFPEKPYRLPPDFSPETPYESRFFSVFYDDTGEIKIVDTSKISAIDREKAIIFAEETLNESDSKGFINEYRYIINKDQNGTQITFLDCGRKLDSFNFFLISSILMAFIGYLVVFAVIFILAGRIIKPINEAYEKQKRFITDAGHEIKTPLTIINANADILEMEFNAPNESLIDIKEQTRRLKNLTEDLVTLSKLEEAGQNMPKIEFPISEVVSECADPFKGLATNEGKSFIYSIEPMLTLNGNDKAIRQLVSIFLDNAFKYSPAGGEIEISLIKQNKFLYLSVYNTTAESIDKNQLRNVFERFYRTDASRNSVTGGHGIGLSIAKAIVTAHGGKIKANANEEKSFTVTAILPI